MPTLNLPIAGGTLAPYTTKPPRAVPGRDAAVQPHRLCGRACGRRSAGRQRSLARHRDRLGAHHRVPPPSVGSRPRRRRGDGHRAARHGPGLAEVARTDPPQLDAAKDFPGALLASGAGTDHLEPSASVTIDDVIRAYEEQCAAIEKLGGQIILMASRALVKAARSPDDYARVYGRILGQVKEPVIIHWLGEMFDPALAGYWGYADHQAAMEVASTSSPTTPPRSTASRFRCSTRTRRSPCAAACRRACACIPATTSTMPS